VEQCLFLIEKFILEGKLGEEKHKLSLENKA
jgi:hypothetical protein